MLLASVRPRVSQHFVRGLAVDGSTVSRVGELTTILKPLLPVARKVLPWALRHPFVLRPQSWWLALLAWFILTALLLAVGVVGPLWFVPLALVLLTIATGLIGWHTLSATSELPIVLITEFRASTSTGLEAAHYHRLAVIERLTTPALREHVEVRSLPVAVNREQAERLLAAVPAVAVVFGSVKAIADLGTWEAELLVRWPSDETASAHVTGDAEELVVEGFDRRTKVPDHHEAVVEAQAPLERLIAEWFESDHVDRIEGTLLVLAAAHHDDEALVRAADQYRPQVSARTRAALEVMRVCTAGFESGTAALEALEEAGLRDANHVDLWNFASALSFLGLLAGEVSVERHASFAQRAVGADPEDPTARYNLGEAYMALDRPEEALNEFARASEHPECRDRYYVHFARGIIAYNLDRAEEARDAYRRATELHPTARGFLYLADAHRRVGEKDEARKNYRRALQLQPTLVDAHRGYWYDLPPSEEAPLVLFDRLCGLIGRSPGFGTRRWRRKLYLPLLRWHYRRHPEDSRIHFMLGAHCLLEGDLETAEERLQFANDLLDGVDWEALARLALVRVQQGRYAEARADLKALHDAPSLETKTPPSAKELDQRLMNLLLPTFEEPRLIAEGRGEQFWHMLLDVFGEEMTRNPITRAGFEASSASRSRS